jgi:2-polyprenyl-6-methoxyphenol hydroxylase-like FAD-dependent oxidoreductase
MQRAVICGAGVTGLALATQLGRSGWDVVVLAPVNGARGGSFLVKLNGDGLDAVKRLGILSSLRSLHEPIRGCRWIDQYGRTVAYNRARSRGRREPLNVLRRDLESTLVEQLPATVDLRAGCRVTAVRTPGSHVEVLLSSGELLSADMLIGADGVHSHIRDLAFGDGTLWGRALGYDRTAFVFEDAHVHAQLDGILTTLSVPGRHVTLCPLRRSSRVAAVLIHRTMAVGSRALSAIERLRRVFGDLPWHVPEVLRYAASTDDLECEQAKHLRMPAWHLGRIALLGEACHAFSLWPGQGTSTVLAAAFLLGREIVRTGAIEPAFEWYEQSLMGAIAQQRAVARRASNWLLPGTRTELVLRNSALRLAALPGVDRFVDTMLDPLV